MNTSQIFKAYQYLNKIDKLNIRFDINSIKKGLLISKNENNCNYHYENDNEEKYYVCIYENVSDLETLNSIIDEIYHMYLYQHRNIHKFIGYDFEKIHHHDDHKFKFYLIFEDIETDIEDKLQQSPNYFTSDIIQKLAHQLLLACYYLHTKDQHQLDINPRNIMIINNNFKLALYGSAKFHMKNEKLFTGNPQYFSPELYDMYVKGKITKIDYSKNTVYSIGLTLLYVASNGEYEGTNSKYRVFNPEAENMKYIKKIIENKPDLPDSFGVMLKMMLTYNVNERPNLLELSTFLTQKDQYLEYTMLSGGALIQTLPFQPQKGYLDGQHYTSYKKGDTIQLINNHDHSTDPDEITQLNSERLIKTTRLLNTDPKLDKIVEKAREKEESSTLKIITNFKKIQKDVHENDDLKSATKEDFTGLNIYYAFKHKTDEDLNKLTNIIKSKQSLIRFTADLTGNEFTEESLIPFVGIFQHFWGMQILDLDFSKGKISITDKIINALSTSISAMKFLKILRLKAQDGPHKITDKSLMSLSQAIKNIQLNELILFFRGGKSQIKDEGMKSLALALKDQINLKKLKLSFSEGFTEITDNGISILAEPFTNLIYLEELELQFSGGFNKITDIGLENFALHLRELISLESVELHIYDGENAIKDEGIIELVTCIYTMSLLRCLKLFFYGGKNSISRKTFTACNKFIKDKFENRLEFYCQIKIIEEPSDIILSSTKSSPRFHHRRSL